MSQFAFGWPLPPHIGQFVYPIFALGFVGGIGVGFRIGSKLHMFALAAAIEGFRMAFVPTAFDFAYANAWIFVVNLVVAIATTDGAKPPPSPSPFILLAAVSPFGEAILCNQGYKAIGGHAIYDTAIAIGVLATEFSGGKALPGKKTN